jgi:hypothetical protein
MEDTNPIELKKTMITWWRYGKEHERIDPNPPYLRANSPAMADEALDSRLARHRAEPADAWRMWRVTPNLMIERVEEPHPAYARADTLFHYLLDQGVAIMENFYSRRYGRVDYIHICEYFFDEPRQSWIMKDLFTDLLVTAEGRLVTVLDLDDLADAQAIGLVSPVQAEDILRRTQAIIRLITNGGYPFKEMRIAHRAAHLLGWLG